MSNVAEDSDIEAGERTFAVTDGQRVEQALRRMLVSAVAGVDDGNVEMARHKIRGAGSSVAHDQAIGLHGVERVDGVEEGLTLFQARRFGLQVHRVCAQARGSSAKADACTGGVFKESESNGFASESGEFFKRMALDFLEGSALVEEKGEFVRGERFESQKVAEAVGHICTLCR